MVSGVFCSGNLQVSILRKWKAEVFARILRTRP